MPVNSDKWTDTRLNAMEKRISGIYLRASKELTEKTEAHFKAFEEKDKAKIKALEAQKDKVSEDEYKKAEAEYQRWRRTQLFQGEQMKELEKTVAAEMLNANKTAVAYVNGELPEVYSINYNGIGDDIARHVKGYSYHLVDAHTVRNLATKNKTLLPYKTVNGKKDARWNTKKVNAEVLQGIVQGESIPKIASRLEKVTEMNRASAIRNARTSVTSAQNRGRLDGMLEAEKKGIILKKEWISSNQSGRTRDWHFPSSFESLEVDTDKPFVNGMGKIMYPGDPNAKPANVYNCRCTMAAVVKGFKKVENVAEPVSVNRFKEKAPNIMADSLTSIEKRSTIKLQHGFSAFPDEDILRERTKKILPKKGYFDIAMHGSQTGVGFGSQEINMSPRTLANIIKHNADYKGENIRLLSCSTGKNMPDGSYCFAEDLANNLGVKVEAPDDILYVREDGSFYVGMFGNGQMITYKPNERRRLK